MRRLLIIIGLMLVAATATRANQAAQGWCESGAQIVVTSGLTSTTQVQASYPSCTVTVFIHGAGLATIYADNNATPTPLSNPFTAQTGGRWQFYAANGRYDIQMSGAGFPTPVTYNDVEIIDPLQASVGLGTLFGPYTPVSFASNVNFPANSAQIMAITLTGNVTSSTISPAAQLGEVIGIYICQDNVGGHTITWPISFLNTSFFSIVGTANACTPTTWFYNGANWQPFAGGGGGGGGSLTSPILTPNPLQFNVETIFQGPNPYVDIRAFGGRQGNLTTTGSCTLGLPTVNVSTANYINGDGVTFYGCGPTSLITSGLTAPTVATGSSKTLTVPDAPLSSNIGNGTFSYLGVAADPNGGLAPAGTATTITNGLTLGLQTATVSTWSLTGNTLTLTFASAPGVGTGTRFHYFNGTTATASGDFQVTGGAGTTALTATTANYSATTTSGTGGSIDWFNGNQITFTSVSNLYRIYVCASRPGDSTYHVIGQTHPNTGAPVGSSDPAILTFTDWGATMTTAGTLPGYPLTSYVTDAACLAASASHAPLTSTVVSGGGTTSLTLANNASATVVNTNVYLDNGPAIKAADAFAQLVNGTVYIPAVPLVVNAGFTVYEPVTVNSRVLVAGILTLGETMTFKSNVQGIRRLAGGQFQWDGNSGFGSFGANPVTIQYSPSTNFSDLGWAMGGNGNIGLYVAQPNQTTQFNLGFSNGPGGDYTSMAIVHAPGSFNTHSDYIAANLGPNQVNDSSWTPAVYFMGSSTQGNSTIMSINHYYLSPRGVYDQQNPTFNLFWTVGDVYTQGATTSAIALYNTSNAPNLFVNIIGRINMDTTIAASVEINGPGSGSNLIAHNLTSNAQETGGFPYPFTGSRAAVPRVDINPLAVGTFSYQTPDGTGMGSQAVAGGNPEGQVWAPTFYMPPTTTAPNALAGTQFFSLAADNWPSFNVNGSATKNPVVSVTGSITVGHCTSWASPTIVQDSGVICGGGGGGPTLQTNGVNNISQGNLNEINSVTNSIGGTVTFTNTSAGNVKAEIGGVINATGGGTGVSNPTAHSIAVAEGSSIFNFLGPGLSGQYLVFQNTSDPIAASPGLPGRTVSAATDTILCDSGTAIRDRAATVEYTANVTITLPDAGSSGCGSNFVFRIMIGGTGISATINRTTTSTFTIYNGTSNPTTSGTSFNMTSGQFATISSRDNVNWIVELTQTANLGTPTTLVGTNITNMPLSGLANEAADTMVANFTSGSAAPTAVAMPTTGTNGCAGTTNALIYNTTTHALGCNTISTSSVAWSSLLAPTSSLAITMPVGDNTQFTYTGNTSTNNLFSLIDATGNTGTGAIFEVHSVGTSTMHPIQFTAQGTANGVNMTSAGLLQPIGTGGINATQINGGAFSGTINDVVGFGGTGNTPLDTGVQYTNLVTATANFTAGDLIQAAANNKTTADSGIVAANIEFVSNKSDVTGQSTSQSAVTLAATPTAGLYRISYYADQNALCTTGANTVSFTFNWTDAGNARSLTTGSLTLSSSQVTSGYLSGLFPINIASGNVTYTSTVVGTCASGTSSYDIHARLERTP